MRCYLHVLNKCLKSAFEECKTDLMYPKCVGDFKFVKKITEDAKRFG